MIVLLNLIVSASLAQSESLAIGYTELRTNLPGGRHANVRTMRAIVAQADGGGRKTIASGLVDSPNAWTQFAGWSPDGKQAIVSRGWQDPENAQWEEEHKAFRMNPGKWSLDSCLVDNVSGKITNVTAVDRVSHYNGGLFFVAGGKSLGFTPLIGGVSRPYIMDMDGRDKRDVSAGGAGFAYGYGASPDGNRVCYHENYQVYISNVDGSEKKHIKTGNPFDFAPKWSPDGVWLLFVSGTHGHWNPYIVKRDGTGLRKLADLNGYQGWILFLDVPDFHDGSSDIPAWSADGGSVFYTAKSGSNVELFQVTLDGAVKQLTRSPPGTLHYHPTPSPDGKQILYGSMRSGIRRLYAMNLSDRTERQVTRLSSGHGAMWPHWRPVSSQP